MKKISTLQQTAVESPEVTLVDFTNSPFDLSIATARTCYSGKGIVFPAEVSSTQNARDIRDRVAASTLAAGHLTTRQHPGFVFAINRVSRHLVWSFLHSHPYYNSEQVSQRYVEVKPDQFYVPPALRKDSRRKELSLYLKTIELSVRVYFELIADIRIPAAAEYYKIFPARAKKKDQYDKVVHKKSIEAARYILPTATYTYLYHTINGLTLHRYRRLCRAYDVPEETAALVEKMYQAVKNIDSLYTDEMTDPLPIEETAEYKYFKEFYESQAGREGIQAQAKAFVREFDSEMGQLSSRLAGFQSGAIQTLSGAVRSVLGISRGSMSDEAAVSLVLNPDSNRHLSSTLNESTLSRLSRALYNVQYTFQKKISHTADSQDQRHRLVPGSRPILMRHFTGSPDYIVPAIVRENPAILEKYERAMEKLFDMISEFVDISDDRESAVYLLPNAFPVRFYESGDLLNLHHKWKSRLCYNAQEEIFRASVEELTQVEDAHPQIGRWIKAPCWVRKQSGTKPFCPEGDKFCGVNVWTKELKDYRRTI